MALAVTDEGDHGGAPVIDGPLGTAAPTKSIVTLRRGGCPHPPGMLALYATAGRPKAARPLSYGCGVPLAGAALLGMTEKGLSTR